MFNRFMTVGVMSAAFVAALSASANAAVLTGGFSIIGTFNPYTCTSITVACVADGLLAATSLDATTTDGAASVGTPGPIMSVDATESFLTVLPNNTFGTLNDFSFTGTGGPGFPIAPISSFELFPGRLRFDLTSLGGTTSAGPFGTAFINLSGVGTFVCLGTGALACDSTPGVFALSAQTAGNTTFSFSASNQAVIPEPGSMMLFGSGLLGLATAARRRFSGK